MTFIFFSHVFLSSIQTKYFENICLQLHRRVVVGIHREHLTSGPQPHHSL